MYKLRFEKKEKIEEYWKEKRKEFKENKKKNSFQN